MRPRIGILLISLLLCVTSCFGTNTNREAYDSFLFVQESSMFLMCVGEDCRLGMSASSGSGFVVATYPGHAVGVTAGHICLDNGPPAFARNIKVTPLSGVSYDTKILYASMDIDICILRIYGYKGPSIEISSDPPKLGDKVQSIAAPMGVFTKGMAPIFDGYYSGRHTGYETDVYTIPTMGGSSGAPIFNKNGELVGMTIARLVGFESLTLSPKYEDIKAVIQEAIKKEDKAERAKLKKVVKEFLQYVYSLYS